MSNAARHRKRAVEFEQLKQFDKAISAYIRAIEESETDGEDVDVALFNKVGDLTLRMGRVPDAVTYYERAVERYATAGLFNNAIALCNKILRNAPGRSGVYFTLGRICAKKGLRGDASRNFLEYAARMRSENRTDEAMRALAEVAEMMPELTEVRGLVEEHAARAGIVLTRRDTPARAALKAFDSGRDLVFLDVNFELPDEQRAPANANATSPFALEAQRDPAQKPDTVAASAEPPKPERATPTVASNVIDEVLIFDPSVITADESANVDETGTDDALFDGERSLQLVELHDDTVTPNAAAVDHVDAAPEGRTSMEFSSGSALEDSPTSVDYVGATGETTLIPGLVTSGEFNDPGIMPVEGLTGIDPESEEVLTATTEPLEALTSRMETITPVATSGIVRNEEYLTPLSSEAVVDSNIEPTIGGLESLDDVNAHDRATFEPELLAFESAHGDSMVTPLDVEPVPEIDQAIADGEATAVMGELAVVQPTEEAIGTPTGSPTETSAEAPPEAQGHAPLRLDPHDFILPGELPPLMIPDALLQRTGRAAREEEVEVAVAESDLSPAAAPEMVVQEVESAPEVVETAAQAPDSEALLADAADDAELAVEVDAALVVDEDAELAVDNDAELAVDEVAEPPVVHGADPAVAEAVAAAQARHAMFEAAVAAAPNDWALRHRFAEALLEVGQRDHGIEELDAVLNGFVAAGDLHAAFEVADELVQVANHRIRHHQKRVELAVRIGEPVRLRVCYLDLADALVRIGEEGRAHAVYARVLELDPRDERARMALGAAAPPMPEAESDDSYVDLASWLRDDDGSTRMRMREPTITGDEQADFDALLRHFKEGVARSIGEDDHDSHYDLGVAYKEMGLLDDAIAEFQKALRSRVHRLPAYEALGQCFVEQGRHQVAATVLSRALHEPGLDDRQGIGVLYLLGYSLEALQRIDDARSYFHRVYATDRNFRDVAARVAALDQVAR